VSGYAGESGHVGPGHEKEGVAFLAKEGRGDMYLTQCLPPPRGTKTANIENCMSSYQFRRGRPHIIGPQKV